MPSKNQVQRYGQAQRIFIRPFSCDRNGLITGEIEYRNPEVFDSPQWNLLNRLNGPAVAGVAGLAGGLGCTKVTRDYNGAQQMASYVFSFEGLQTTDFGFDNGDDKTFEVDVAMREEPIETHPDFDTLRDKYGWDATRKEFFPNIPADNSQAGLAAAADRSKRATSPMYGVTSYLVPGITYRLSYTRKTVPSGILDNIGTIDNPPGLSKFPELQKLLSASTRNWLKLAPKITQRGTAVTITEEWLLSGVRGVNKDIYGKSALSR